MPAEPKRVAADQYMGHLLKLGIIPVGVRSFMLEEGWFERAGISKETLSKIEDLGGFPIKLEKLTYLEPDLIIGSVEANIEQYEKIGTTVFLPYCTGETTAGPLEKFRSISEIFGKQKEAEEWISAYEKKVVEAQKKIQGIIKEKETVSKEGFEAVSLEVLPEYLEDHIFVYNGDPAAIKRIMDTDLWKNLPAVKKNQVYLYGNEFPR